MICAYRPAFLIVISLAACYFMVLFSTPAVNAAPATHKSAAYGPPLGSAAPVFVLPDMHGRPVGLDDYKDKIRVLNFWAFWCDTWKAEMPHLLELSLQQKNLGFQIVALSVDGTRLAEFQHHADYAHTPFPVLMDLEARISTQYHISHVPTVVIIDRSGRVRYTTYGYPGNYIILREIRKIISSQTGMP